MKESSDKPNSIDRLNSKAVRVWDPKTERYQIALLDEKGVVTHASPGLSPVIGMKKEEAIQALKDLGMKPVEFGIDPETKRTKLFLSEESR